MPKGDSETQADEFNEELFQRCELIVGLSGPQIEGFVSGLFVAWDNDQQGVEFIEWCQHRPGVQTATICAGLAGLDHGPIGQAARRVLDTMASAIDIDGSPELRAELDSLASSRPAQAWQVDAAFGKSIVVGFASGAGDIDHAVLAEISAGRLVDLQLSGAPEEMLDVESLDQGAVSVSGREVGTAIEEIASAWRASHNVVEPTSSMLANQRLVRARFARSLTDPLPLFRLDMVESDLSRGMSEADISEANRAARATLLAALGDVEADAGINIEPAWTEIMWASIPGISVREREALLWLEWADWLGVGIGLVRGLDGGAELDGQALVDLVNRCPEVSSTIHGDDRDYAAWAFAVALDHLADIGAIVDGALTDKARAKVHSSLVATWTP